jgi:hypothetical protein
VQISHHRETGAAWIGAVSQAVVGAGATTLDFLDAFGVTERSKLEAQRVAMAPELAEMQLEAARLAAKQSDARIALADTLLTVGLAGAALGAVWLMTRK